VLLAYAKNIDCVLFHPPNIEADADWIEREYRFEDEHGRFMIDNLTASGTRNGPCGLPWRDVDPKKVGAGRHWRFLPETLDKLEKEGRIHWPATGQYPKLKVYLGETRGKAIGDLWMDVGVMGRTSKERLGYPTQKPEALLERIILASSPEHGLVLDPFCGCGTTIAAAERLHRRWIGIDITHLAISLMKSRLRDGFGYDLAPFEVLGVPKDTESARELAQQNRYHFEWWALGLVEARPAQDKKKGSDSGVDGLIYFRDDESGISKKVVVQVKSGHVGAAQIRDLKGVLEREKAALALFLTLEEPTRPMKEEAATAGFYQAQHFKANIPRIQIFTIEELLTGKRPELPRMAPPETFKRAERKSKASPEPRPGLFEK
jgi:site-specific DNA-methyltransferase (adenine-specific)